MRCFGRAPKSGEIRREWGVEGDRVKVGWMRVVNVKSEEKTGLTRVGTQACVVLGVQPAKPGISQRQSGVVVALLLAN